MLTPSRFVVMSLGSKVKDIRSLSRCMKVDVEPEHPKFDGFLRSRGTKSGV